MTDRAGLIRLIHVARRDLALDDDAYRAIIQAQTGGKTSSPGCTLEELDAVLRHMRRSGFRIRHAKPVPSRKLDTSAEATKVRALWLLLHQIKWAQRKLPAYLEARMAHLQLAGLVDPRNTLSGLLAFVAPKRDPSTFDAQWAAWEYLAILEIEHLKQCQDRGQA